MSYLKLSIPIVLKMISWLNMALKELSANKEFSFTRENLKFKIELVDTALIAEFASLNKFIKDCAANKREELDLAIIAKR